MVKGPLVVRMAGEDSGSGPLCVGKTGEYSGGCHSGEVAWPVLASLFLVGDFCELVDCLRASEPDMRVCDWGACHSAGDGLTGGVTGTWAVLESAEGRSMDISDCVGCSVSQEGRSLC